MSIKDSTTRIAYAQIRRPSPNPTSLVCACQSCDMLFYYSAVSGIVEEVSDAVANQTGLQRGDSVMALVGGGGYAGQL